MNKYSTRRLGQIIVNHLETRDKTLKEFDQENKLWRGKSSELTRDFGKGKTLDVEDFFSIAQTLDRNPLDLAKELGIVDNM